MNLKFLFVKDEGDFIIQKANVTNNGKFWAAWRLSKAKQAESARLRCLPPPALLSSLITLSRETIDGTDYWFAYRRVAKNPAQPVPPFSLSFRLSTTDKLLPFQPPAVAHLCNSIVSHGAAADGSDTGIGKTYIALSCAINLKYQPAIVCKIAGIASWKRACNYFGIEPLFIINWEQAKGSKFRYIKRSVHEYSGATQYKWNLPPSTLLIFDEAHAANNHGSLNSGIYLAAKGIPSLSCSATFADRPTRLGPLFHLLGIVPIDTFEPWLKSRSDAYFVDERDKLEFLSDTDEMLSFNKLLYPYHGYRLSYENPDVKKYFPECVYQTQIVSIGIDNERRQNALYKDMIAKVEYYKQQGKQAEKLVAEMRYRQATELLKSETLADLAKNYIDEGHSVCVFVNYRETLAHLAKLLNTKSLIFGNQEQYGISRTEVIDDFQADKSRIILCMADAGGQSISLHDLHGRHPRISLICPTYDSIKLKQILGRTYRAGSKTTPVIKLVYAAGTIEEKVSEIVNRKLANISALQDGDLMEEDLFKMGVDAK